ncbi:chorismate mutase [Synechococcus sp. BSF8S]|uniref:chorismate mutase n=1 Tax=Synechococcales TaxID=1890424 RepID=UPI00162873DB|nr:MULTISPECIES: chorismate mutase [unclassified Synechococcus]MBC1261376.1 chorismate mutase [Synechococcus sp. BSF8S]MBC1264406.1 chorismate mutase [Synechococcus sp. BSA11S]
MTEALELRALRGATTAMANTTAAIEEAVSELLASLIAGNGLSGSQMLSVTFSVTADLDAGFPAAVARRQPGWDGVALLDCQQMAVAGDLPRCIRLLAHAWMEPGRPPLHPYLREAARLRPDRSGHN